MGGKKMGKKYLNLLIDILKQMSLPGTHCVTVHTDSAAALTGHNNELINS